MVQNQFGLIVQQIRSGTGCEFTNSPLQNYFLEHDVTHETSSANTPQQNERVERKNRHLLSVARALRFQANLPFHFWGKCVLTAAYLVNRTPTKLLEFKTPYEVLFGVKRTYDHLKVFGCLCYAHNHDQGKDKFDSRLTKCIFLGYSYNQKGSKLYDVDKRKIIIS